MDAKTLALEGVVHGKTIELIQEPGFPDGQVVSVTLKTVDVSKKRLPPGEGLRRAFGAWAEDAKELDQFVEEARQRRKRRRREIEP